MHALMECHVGPLFYCIIGNISPQSHNNEITTTMPATFHKNKGSLFRRSGRIITTVPHKLMAHLMRTYVIQDTGTLHHEYPTQSRSLTSQSTLDPAKPNQSRAIPRSHQTSYRARVSEIILARSQFLPSLFILFFFFG